MAWLSRFANIIERMVSSLDADHGLEDEDAAGLWMSTADALEARPGAPDAFTAAPALPDIFAAPRARLPEDPPPTEPASGPRVVVQLRVAPEAPSADGASDEPVLEAPGPVAEAAPLEQVETQPSADTPPEIAYASAEPAVETTAVEHVTASAGPADDMLSMFRESVASSEHSDLTKEIDDITARELLDEARAVLDLLTPQRVPSEEDAIA